jgi:hypothetical protein
VQVSRTRHRILVALVVSGVLFCAADAALVAVRLTWQAPVITPGGSALGRVHIAGWGETVAAVGARDASGRAVPVSFVRGTIVPDVQLPVGTRIHLTATVHRSRWVGWLLGHDKQVEAVTRTPSAWVKQTMVYAKPGHAVAVRFSRPVQVVSMRLPGGTPTRIVLRRPHRVAPIGIIEGGDRLAGTVFVSGAPRAWERPPKPLKLNWFPAGPVAHVLVRPSTAETLAPATSIVLTFSRPVDEVLGTQPPMLRPKVTGTWHQPNPNTLVFQPSGLGFPLGRRVHLRLPRAVEVVMGSDPAPYRTLTWQVPRGSLVRMKQLLADLGYLPLAFEPAGGPVPLTPAAQTRAAVDPPDGTFEWRYAKTPWKLQALWKKEADRATIVRGAIMAYQSAHGMNPDGFPSMIVFQALLRDELAGRHARGGYSYVYVTQASPETLTLWHDGKVILKTAVNTGIAGRPTDIGTFPVYLHLTSTTMEGTNPDGSHYSDAGVPWVNYFSGGDAIHGFVRPGYGWPQSLGCVEVYIPTAEQIFPYVNVGTLVTVAPPPGV